MSGHSFAPIAIEQGPYQRISPVISLATLRGERFDGARAAASAEQNRQI